MDKPIMDQIIDWPRMRDNLKMKANLECKNENEMPEEGFVDKHLIDQIFEHLKFLGYEIEIKQGRAACLHERKRNFMVGGFYGGIYLKTLYDSTDYAKANRGDYLSFINQLNREALVACISVNDEWAAIFYAWFPGIYDKKQFGVFMDLWDHDTNDILMRSEPETKKFIG